MKTARWTTIPGLLDDAATRFPQLDAVSEAGVRCTYAELAREVHRAARALIASGVQPGDRIAIWAPNITEWVVSALAIYDVGAVMVPINTRFKGGEAAFVLRRTKARLLFTVQGFLDTDYVQMISEQPDLDDLREIVVLRGDAAGNAIDNDTFLARGAGVDDAERRKRAAAVRADDLCHILFTSGTTGDPKGVMLAHGQICEAYQVYCDEIGLGSDDNYLIVVPFFHSFGLHSGILSCLMTGATIVPQLVFDTRAVAQTIATERITAFPGPPTVFQSLLDDPAASDGSLDTLRLTVVSAATVPVELVRAIRDRLGVEKVVTGYGLTEASGIVAMCRHDDEPEVIAQTAGRPLPGVELRIISDDGADLGRGEAGEIWVRGTNVMQGYLDEPERTAEAVDADGWLHTGDIGMVRADGNLVVTDRKKEIYIAGGFNVSPAEVEKLMLTNPDLQQVAVVGVRDKRLGEVGYAYVVPKTGAVVDPIALRAWCRNRMANYKVPHYIEVINAFPLNATGKVLKFVLRDRATETLQETST